MLMTTCTPPCAPNPAERIPGVAPPCGGGQCPPTGGGGGGMDFVVVADSSSLDFRGNGLPGNALSADVKVSATAGNLVTINPDGLFVALPEFDSYYDIAASVTTGVAANEIIFAFQFSSASQIPADFTDSIGIAENHTGTAIIDIQINGTSIGTATVTDGVVTFSAMPARNVNRGDVLTLVSSSVATFDYLAITLVASKTVRYV